MFTKDLAMLSYIKKKKNRSVHVISSQQNDDTISPDIQNKPYIRFYIIIATKGGVDNAEKLGEYSCSRRTNSSMAI